MGEAAFYLKIGSGFESQSGIDLRLGSVYGSSFCWKNLSLKWSVFWAEQKRKIKGGGGEEVKGQPHSPEVPSLNPLSEVCS